MTINTTFQRKNRVNKFMMFWLRGAWLRYKWLILKITYFCFWPCLEAWRPSILSNVHILWIVGQKQVKVKVWRICFLPITVLTFISEITGRSCSCSWEYSGSFAWIGSIMEIVDLSSTEDCGCHFIWWASWPDRVISTSALLCFLQCSEHDRLLLLRETGGHRLSFVAYPRGVSDTLELRLQ